MTDDAERDIEDICRHVAAYDAIDRAAHILANLERTCRKLSIFPDRGNVPKELARIGISDYREIHWKPCRIVYRIDGRRVLIYCVLDGRRDIRTLLQHRLLR